MKVLIFRYPRNKITDILISLFCVFTIILILQYDSHTKPVSSIINEESVISFLQSNNIEIDVTGMNVSYIVLSDENGEVFYNYNEMQKQNGFDLSPFVGKKIQKYSGPVIKCPDCENVEGVYATVLTYEDKIIGADIYSVSVNGFMRGVKNNLG